jgi:tetratricopeptide (TPR) repeat protein
MTRVVPLTLALCPLLVASCLTYPGRAEYDEAVRLYEAGKHDEAIEAARRSLDENPDAAPAHWLIATIYEQRGEWFEAVQELQEILDRHPGLLHAGNRIGEILVRNGKREKAREYFEACLQVNEDYLPARTHLGVMAFEEGDTEAAIYHLHRAVKSYPKVSRPRLQLAGVLHHLGRNDEARQQVEAALKCKDLRPEDREQVEKFLAENLGES